jgi:hypothetical protein
LSFVLSSETFKFLKVKLFLFRFMILIPGNFFGVLMKIRGGPNKLNSFVLGPSWGFVGVPIWSLWFGVNFPRGGGWMASVALGARFPMVWAGGFAALQGLVSIGGALRLRPVPFIAIGKVCLSFKTATQGDFEEKQRD